MLFKKWVCLLKQLHSYDYGGPYAGFEGAVNFYKEMERMVGTKIWQDDQATLAGRTGNSCHSRN